MTRRIRLVQTPDVARPLAEQETDACRSSSVWEERAHDPETVALIKILTFRSLEVAEGKVKPIADVVKRLRALPHFAR